MIQNYSVVLQNTWAFTSSESEKPQLKTGIIGPCFVVNFIQQSSLTESRKYVAMAHVDSKTELSSIRQIFERFAAHGVDSSDVKVIVIGGWENPELRQREAVLLSSLIAYGVSNISLHTFSKKNMITALMGGSLITPPTTSSHVSKLQPYYHMGFMIDSQTGKAFILKEIDKEIDRLDLEREKQSEREGTILDVKPLTEMNQIDCQSSQIVEPYLFLSFTT